MSARQAISCGNAKLTAALSAELTTTPLKVRAADTIGSAIDCRANSSSPLKRTEITANSFSAMTGALRPRTAF
jgi:hypothetical protein